MYFLQLLCTALIGYGAGVLFNTLVCLLFKGPKATIDFLLARD